MIRFIGRARDTLQWEVTALLFLPANTGKEEDAALTFFDVAENIFPQGTRTLIEPGTDMPRGFLFEMTFLIPDGRSLNLNRVYEMKELARLLYEQEEVYAHVDEPPDDFYLVIRTEGRLVGWLEEPL